LEDLGMENVDICSGHLEHFTTIGYILWAFGIFSPDLVHCTKKNLATLRRRSFDPCY
jgi:hypothetical protein